MREIGMEFDRRTINVFSAAFAPRFNYKLGMFSQIYCSNSVVMIMMMMTSLKQKSNDVCLHRFGPYVVRTISSAGLFFFPS